ncbi:MAG TPA: YigZ family protein, partial [Cyclobacteriaceae bacterium]
RSKNLTNVLVVVVRYFGGVKLGVGGLISAYKLAAEDALNKAILIEKEVFKSISLTYDYTSTPEVMRLVKEFEITITSQDFKDKGELNGEVRLKDHQTFLDKVTLLKALGNSIFLMDKD